MKDKRSQNGRLPTFRAEVIVFVSVLVALMLIAGPLLLGQQDPGPRGGPVGVGGPYLTSSPAEMRFFDSALLRFIEVSSVSGTLPGEPGKGLGPSYNANSCAACHAEPTVGGSSPGLNSRHMPTSNPQVALANLDGAANAPPSFITADGPVREARYKSDGAVHGLFTIRGRTDAAGCELAQPDFNRELARHNVGLRIPTPLFGLGLVENTPEATLVANLASDQTIKLQYGITGVFNISSNDGTISRFGWKAQNKSLMMFSAEAYNVEQGVTNEHFPNERDAVPGCVFNHTPEDYMDMADLNPSDISMFAGFIRLSAPPNPMPMTPSAEAGEKLFASIGCALCHTRSLATGASPYTGLNNITYHPLSDFALHHMGSGLADGITQGTAGPDQFRTAPLWGIGQRLFFLHDGRTTDLLEAIQAHSGPHSEANKVVGNFLALKDLEKQEILDFLRSL